MSSDLTLKDKFPNVRYTNVFWYTHEMLGYEQYTKFDKDNKLDNFFFKYKYGRGKPYEYRNLSNLNYEEFAKELTVYILSLN